MEEAFITGATGFIGTSLLKALIEETNLNSFKLLIRNKEKATEDLLEIIKIAESLGKKIEFLKGDITLVNLGLTSNELSSLKDTNEIYHLASNISLSNEEKDKEAIFNVNINGTKNILEIFKDSKDLNNFYFFSSAFCCGKTKEIVKEDWLQKPDNFRNFYEESKWLTENLIKKYIEEKNMPVIILRPSIVAISSNNEFSKVRNQTFYFYSRILRKAAKMQSTLNPIRLIGKSTSISNIITLDDLIKILLEIRKQKERKIIYNLVNLSNLSTNSFVKEIRENLGFEPGFIFLEEFDYNSLSEAEKFIYDRTKAYFEYNLDDISHWDCSNTKEIRGKLNIKELDNVWIKEHIKEFFSFLENERQ
jgi:nucleoside-diphosphate-sugar epimerase